MDPQAVLEKLGYSPHEARIYLVALEMADATVSELAHKADLPRTSVQEALVSMQRKGLVSSYDKHSHKYWIAENPEKIFSVLREHEEEFKAVLPQLQKLRPAPDDIKPRVKVFSGVREIKYILDDIINTKHNISALISWEDWTDFFGSEYIKEFIERRYKHFLRIRVITSRTPHAQHLKEHDQEQLRQTRFLPPNVDLKRISNFIYGNKIAIISMNKKEPTGIVIEDPDVVHGNSLYFENLWHSSSDK